MQKDSATQPVHNVKSQDIASTQELSAQEADVAKRFQGEVQELKQLIEGGNTLSDLCAAIGKQPLPPHLQVAKDRLLHLLTRSLDNATHDKLKETLEQARDSPARATPFTKSFIASYPHARRANATILLCIASMLDQKLSHLDPKLKEQIATSIMKRAEGALEKAQHSFQEELSEQFSEHLGDNAKEGNSLPETVKNCKEATQKFFEARQGDKPSQPGAIGTFTELSERAATGLLEQLKSKSTETMTEYQLSLLTDGIITELEKEFGSKMKWLADEAISEGVVQSPKDSEKEAESFTKALETHLHKKVQKEETSCTQADFLEALEGCQNEEEIALVIGKILVEVTDRTDNVLYEQTLKLLQEIYPDINKFCLDKGDGHRLLSPLGVEVMLETLKQKGKLHDIPTHLCLAPEQAIGHLEQLANGAPGEKMSLVMRYDDGVNQSNEAVESIHYFAVIAEKSDQGLRIAITDSFSSNHYRSEVVDGIQERFTNLGIPCKVFVPKIVRHPETGREITFRRQSDSYSCPIFALRDISQFSQHPEILDEIESHASPPETDDNVQVVPFERVPKALMKATQSLTKLADYDDKSVTTQLRRSGKINPLPVKGSPGKVKDANTFIMDRNRKYERIMIAAAIAKGLVKPHKHG
ncbi:MAG: hypothetical protein LLG04_01620 [Parachlamydia sp.]|nr:hypothetical protein [Parachlamydia sp.]